MELLYLYIDSYRSLKNKEFNFGSDIRFRYDKETKTIRKAFFENPLPENFWGERINNLTMIVGNNGMGKTSTMHCIIDFLRSTVYEEQTDGSGAFVFRDEEKYYLYVVKDSDNNFDILQSENEPQMIKHGVDSNNIPRALEKLWETKLIFITNMLNDADYKRRISISPKRRNSNDQRYDFLYDCSLGNLLFSAEKSAADHTQGNPDTLKTYFYYEKYRQVKFVFDARQYETLTELKKDYPVPLPKRLYIVVAMKHPNDFVYDYFEPESLMKPWHKKYARIDKKNIDMPFEQLQYHLSCGCVYNVLNSIYNALNKADQSIENRSVEQYPDKQKSINHFVDNFKNDTSELSMESMYRWFDALLTKIRNTIKSQKLESELTEHILWLENQGKEFINLIYKQKVFLKNDTQFVEESRFRVYIDSDNWFLAKNKTTTNWLKEFMQKYRYICYPDYFLDFHWDLSSGENNLLNLFASLYFIFDSDYASGRYGDPKLYNKPCNSSKVECENAIVLVDEADLTYHPEWQRQFISLLTAFLPKIYPSVKMQIILSTHSPIILSDVPSSNVEYLGHNEEKEKTFGQNIHTLFVDSFSEKPIGEFANKKIVAVNDYLKGNASSVKSLPEAKAIIDMIGEDVIRKALLSKYDEISKREKPAPLPIFKEYDKLSTDDRRALVQHIIDSQEKLIHDKD